MNEDGPDSYHSMVKVDKTAQDKKKNDKKDKLNQALKDSIKPISENNWLFKHLFLNLSQNYPSQLNKKQISTIYNSWKSRK